MGKMKLTVNIEQETKDIADELKELTGYTLSHIIELLVNGATKKEIVALHEQSLKEKNK
jgi:alkylhydroperoxidase/carboxymuconolactone decarboxylase family protein YurZ